MEKESKKDKEKEEKKKKKKWSLKTKFFIVFVLIVLLLVAGFVGLYLYSPIGKLTRPIFKNVPYPVAIVGNLNALITSSELISNVEAVRRFYESQDYSKIGLRVDFTTDDGKKRLKVKEKDIFDKLIEDKIVEMLANERGIIVSKADAQKAIDKKIAEVGDKKALELSLDSIYGWTIDEFRDKVVVYQLYFKGLFSWYALNIQDQKEYKKIVKAKQILKNDGSNFSEVVGEYSEGESVKSDGEMGWFKKEELIEEVSLVAFSMEKEEISKIIISPLGSHIIQLQDKRTSEIENGEKVEEIKVRQIFVEGTSFLEWLGQQKKKAKVIILMKDYSWDSAEGQVKFVDKNLERIEKKLRIQADGDPSL
ncbi:MAG: peptidylprolyl isomerase [Patescibacteria group bacterium]|nr:peptidylprolyl isomerase [Patescibacteria group bacterium]